MKEIIKQLKNATFKKYNKTLVCSSKYRFYEYYNVKNFNDLSLKSKYPILQAFFKNSNKFDKIKRYKG